MEMGLRFFGYLGTVLLLFGVLGAVIMQSFTGQPLIVLHLVLGVLCLAAWAVTSGFSSLSKATAVISGRTARFGYNVAFYTIVFVGLLVVANVFATMHDWRWDLTQEGVYSLSEKSRKVLEGLKAPVRLVAVDNPAVQDKEQTRQLLKLYKYSNDKMVSTELVDPAARPLEVEALGMKAGNLMLIEYGEGAAKAVSRINTVDEQSVTNAIVKLSRGAAKKLYYVQGHGEPGLDSAAAGGMKQFADGLSDEHLTVEGLLLAQAGSVPEDAAAVVLAAPKRPLQESERQALIQYAEKGGRLVLFANAEDRDADDVRAIAKAFGIEVGRDIILDEQLRLFAGPQLGVQFVAQGFAPHPITSGTIKSEPPVFSFASSVLAPSGKAPGVTYTELVKAGPKSWAERNLDLIFDSESPSASLDPEDLKGPVSVAVAMEKRLPQEGGKAEGEGEKVARVVVFGDASWIENGNFGLYGNRDLALNVVNWSAGEEGNIAIGPKKIKSSNAPFERSKFLSILALSFVGPEIILIFGLFVWWRRRSLFA